MSKARVVIGVAAALLFAACGDARDPVAPQLPQFHDSESSPTETTISFLEQAETAPLLETLEVAVWVVKGERKSIKIDYSEGVLPDSLRGFLRLDFHKRTLAALHGEAIADGDSILVRVSIDLDEFRFGFGPSGLTFDRPVRLRVRYHQADPDLDDDGDVDEYDEQIRVQLLGVWLQDGAAWVHVEHEHSLLSRKFDAQLDHFSNYAIGW